jgi:hypothetical protein
MTTAKALAALEAGRPAVGQANLLEKAFSRLAGRHGASSQRFRAHAGDLPGIFGAPERA